MNADCNRKFNEFLRDNARYQAPGYGRLGSGPPATVEGMQAFFRAHPDCLDCQAQLDLFVMENERFQSPPAFPGGPMRVTPEGAADFKRRFPHCNVDPHPGTVAPRTSAVAPSEAGRGVTVPAWLLVGGGIALVASLYMLGKRS